MTSLVTSIFVHDIRNPPKRRFSSDISIQFSDPLNRIRMTKIQFSEQTEYEVKILDCEAIGFPVGDETSAEASFEVLVLSANLLLDFSVFSSKASQLSRLRIQKDKKPAIVEGDQIDGRTRIRKWRKVPVSVSMTQHSEESLSIDEVIDLFGQISRLNRSKIYPDDLQPMNLSEALNEYRLAMDAWDRLAIFKHLFDSLELAVGSDVIDRKGDEFDLEVSELTDTARCTVERWRLLYNRTKHIDRTSTEVERLISGMENLRTDLLPLRRCTQTVIGLRLRAIQPQLKM